MIWLKITERAPATDVFAPAIKYKIMLDDTEIGKCDLRLDHNDRLYYGGNIGYAIFEPFRGHRYAARAVDLLMDEARSENLGYVYITCNPDNIPSKRTCEMSSGKFVECAEIPEWHDMYKRGEREVLVYKFDLSGNYHIRSARADDADDMGVIYCDAWKKAYNGIMPREYLDSLTYENSRPRGVIAPGSNIVAVKNGHAVGVAFLRKGELGALYVRPEFQKTGAGAQLFRAALERLNGHCVLWTLAQNKSAIGFYNHMGMRENGITRDIEIGGAYLKEIQLEM